MYPDTFTRSGGSESGQRAQQRERWLLPVDATERSRWPIAHVISQARAGVALEIDLLFVAEPVTSWQVLRFRTQAEVAAFQRQYAQWLLADAAETLKPHAIPVHTHYREGDIVFEIVDCAEQLGCARIVMPRPYPRWLKLLGRDIVRAVIASARAIEVVTVDEQGQGLQPARSVA
jgi:hypothetical protein